jgi:hypothetical protein
MNSARIWPLLAAAWLGVFAPAQVWADHCDSEPSLRALVAPWNAADQEFLGGRTRISYYFEMQPRTYRVVYGNAKGEISRRSPRQTLRSDPFYEHEKELGIQLIEATDRLISLDFFEVSRAQDADLVIVGYCDAKDQKEGAVTQNADGTQYIMILNGCRGIATGKEDPVWLFLHEFGHALGLEHPFSDVDGDCLYDNQPWSKTSAHAGTTVMAYKPRPGQPPQFFTDYDIAVLRLIWGAE